jgi:hypothetical protein
MQSLLLRTLKIECKFEEVCVFVFVGVLHVWLVREG